MNTGSEKTPSQYRPNLEVLRSNLNRCFCTRCGNYFRNEDSFTAHQFRVGRCHADEKGLRSAGLRVSKTLKTGDLEWTL